MNSGKYFRLCYLHILFDRTLQSTGFDWLFLSNCVLTCSTVLQCLLNSEGSRLTVHFNAQLFDSAFWTVKGPLPSLHPVGYMVLEVIFYRWIDTSWVMLSTLRQPPSLLQDAFLGINFRLGRSGIPGQRFVFQIRPTAVLKSRLDRKTCE